MRQWVPLGAVMATYSPLSTKVASRNGCLQSPGVTLSGENLNRFSSELKLQYYCYSTCYRCFGSLVQRLSISKPTPVFWKVKSAEHTDCSMLLTVGCTSCKAATFEEVKVLQNFFQIVPGPCTIGWTSLTLHLSNKPDSRHSGDSVGPVWQSLLCPQSVSGL